MKNTMRCLIVAGGDADSEFVTRMIKNGGYEVILAADAGMEVLYRIGIHPDIIVGDFDSVDPKILEYFQEQEQVDICTLNIEKNDTDTEHAIREAIARGAGSITIIGGTGSRLDHVLGNISLLGIGLKEQVEMMLVDEHNRIRMIDHEISIERDQQYGRFVSLIPYTGTAAGVTLAGFKYPLTDASMGGANTLGISNEIVDEVAHITLQEGCLLVIESQD